MSNTERKYDLRCLICEEEFQIEMNQKDYRLGEARCTNCGSPAVERDFSKGHDIQVNDITRSRKGKREDKW